MLSCTPDLPFVFVSLTDNEFDNIFTNQHDEDLYAKIVKAIAERYSVTENDILCSSLFIDQMFEDIETILERTE